MSSHGLTPGRDSIFIASAVNTVVLISHQSPKLTASNAGAGQITLTLVDQNGNPVNAVGNITLRLSASSNTSYFTIYLGGTGSITSIVIPSGTSSVVVHFRDTVAENLTLNATRSSSGATVSGSAPLQIVVGPFSQITMAPTPLSVQWCTTTSTQIDLQAEDQFGNPTSIGVPTQTYYLIDSG